MRSSSIVAVSFPLLLSGTVTAFKHPKIPIPEMPLPPEKAAISEVHTFQQLIDHENPELGTFPQRYWFNDEWWEGKGAPVSYDLHICGKWLIGRSCYSLPVK